ncbi:MAG: hypothetical protein AAF557_17920 [Pseudomonadota bacterium]
MGGGLRFVALWCAASILGTVAVGLLLDVVAERLSDSSVAGVTAGFIIIFISAVLAPVLHWFLLKPVWKRPYLFLWLFYVIVIPLLIGMAFNFFLVTPLLSEFQAALRADDGNAMAAAESRVSVWWRQALLATTAYTGYAVGLSYISVRVGTMFFLAVIFAMAAMELILDLSLLNDLALQNVLGDVLWSELVHVTWVSLCGGSAIWIASKPVRGNIDAAP